MDIMEIRQRILGSDDPNFHFKLIDYEPINITEE